MASQQPASPAQQAYDGLSWFKRWLVRRGFSVSLGMEQPPGYSKPTKMFLFWCPEHDGPSKSSCHGYDDRLDCDRCTEPRRSAAARSLRVAVT